MSANARFATVASTNATCANVVSFEMKSGCIRRSSRFISVNATTVATIAMSRPTTSIISHAGKWPS